MNPQYNANDLDLAINPQVLKSLFATNSYRHALAIAYNWALIFASILLSLAYPYFAVYLFSVIVIGARMHALAILMHDATHFRFLKNRKWNDLITNVVTAYPLFTTIATYRENHLRHHRHLNTEEDPDWVSKLGKREFRFPKTKREFLLTVFSYFFLIQGMKDSIWFFRRFASAKKDTSCRTEDKRPRILFFALLLLTLTLGGLWLGFLLFWVIPYLSTFFMFQYIRSVAEHFGELSYDHLLTSTRTVRVNFLERFFIAPHNVGYHLEHHLYPGVPFYHLPQLHKVLMADAAYSNKAHITHGYLTGLLNELSGINS
ncbi:MAG TPA: fatty acid desaturase family protein [Saprospiraceae bacterium]|nr:fatty acid desaturase family protein [Saprospiraceae bacterium]HMQ83980.1 fatty acid desaturase family protein [Saprospiraceae bacterium]